MVIALQLPDLATLISFVPHQHFNLVAHSYTICHIHVLHVQRATIVVSSVLTVANVARRWRTLNDGLENLALLDFGNDDGHRRPNLAAVERYFTALARSAKLPTGLYIF